jgi:GT2 family glycosyltransferase
VIRVPHSPRPRASILLIAWRNAGVLERCLLALASGGCAGVDAEIVIILNDAEPDVATFVRRQVAGVVVIASEIHLGFAGANNAAARAASGEFLVLLNDDTAPEPGWLEALVRAADRFPNAGAVGSRVMFPDGSLQEAGSILWSNGVTSGIGRGADERSFGCLAVREVDYCSGCSLLVRRATWNAIAGLSEEFFPSYYEDVDLCLAIQALGQAVLYTPESRVAHHESRSSRDERFKAFVFKRNGDLFRAKWAEHLAGCEPYKPTSRAARERAIVRASGVPRRLLVIDDWMPNAHLGAGFPRMRDTLGELAGRYAITLCVTHEVPKPDRALAELGIEILRTPLEIELNREGVFYDAVMISRPLNFHRSSAIVRRRQPQAALIYDAEALYHVRMSRYAALESDPGRRGELQEKADAMREIEIRIASAADTIVSISEDEARFFRAENAAPVTVIRPTLSTASFGERTFRERSDIGFVPGWLGGEVSTNTDGLKWFVSHVLPIIRDKRSFARVLVTGQDPPASVRQLASDGVVLVGHQPNLTEFYSRVRVVIAPVRYGAGVKLKSIEAIQHGVPLVATAQGAEGIDGLEPAAIAVAEEPEAFAASVLELLTDQRRWNEGHSACRRMVTRWTNEPGETWSQVLERTLLARSPEVVAQRVRQTIAS